MVPPGSLNSRPLFPGRSTSTSVEPHDGHRTQMNGRRPTGAEDTRSGRGIAVGAAVAGPKPVDGRGAG